MAKSKHAAISAAVLANHYLAAAKDSAAAFQSLYDGGHHALLIYTAGLSVECLFRAYRARKELSFSSQHSLSLLATEAGFSNLLPEKEREIYDASLSDLIVGWDNVHRFRSNAEMRRFLKGLKLDRGVQGDFLKENARRLSSAAVVIINLGVQRWTR